MKAVVIYAPGGPEQLIYQEVPTPKIKESWSLVRVRGFGLNHSEIFTREGKSPSVQFPRGIRAAAGRADLSHRQRLRLANPGRHSRNLPHRLRFPAPAANSGRRPGAGAGGGQWWGVDFAGLLKACWPAISLHGSCRNPERKGERLQGLFNFMARHRVPEPIERIYRLDQPPDAHRFLESTAGFGKVVVVNK